MGCCYVYFFTINGSVLCAIVLKMFTISNLCKVERGERRKKTVKCFKHAMQLV